MNNNKYFVYVDKIKKDINGNIVTIWNHTFIHSAKDLQFAIIGTFYALNLSHVKIGDKLEYNEEKNCFYYIDDTNISETIIYYFYITKEIEVNLKEVENYKDLFKNY